MGLLKKIGSHLPHLYLNKIGELLTYIRSETPPERYGGQVLVYSLLISLALTGILFILNLPVTYLLVLFVLGFLLAEVFFYLILVLIADKRAKEIEGYLPDALILISANLRAGMTVDKAIWSATRPEFGPLEEEMSELGRDVVGGKPFSEALISMGKRIDSSVVKQTIKLIDEGIKSGGELESLLYEIAQDIRAAERLKEEIKANTAMYIIFMFFAAMLAAPLLFGMSIKLIEISGLIQEPIETVPMAQLPGMPVSLMFEKQRIGPDQIFLFYLIEIVIITSFAGLALGLIQEGSEKRGLKYLPALIVIGLATFLLSKNLMGLILFI